MKSKIRDLQILFQKGDLNGAKNLCEEILSNQIINDPKIYNLYAYVLYKLNNYEHSIENWKKSLKLTAPSQFMSVKELAHSFSTIVVLPKSSANKKKSSKFTSPSQFISPSKAVA